MTPETDLEALLARCVLGDETAVQGLIDATMDDIRGFVAVMARRSDLVDDVVHETYVDAILGAARYESGRSVVAWLKGIARHRLQSRLRSDWRRSRNYDPQALAASELVAVVAEPPDALMEQEESGLRAQALRICLESLPAHLRQLLERFYHQRQSLAELAADGERNPMAIAKSLSRCRAALRACLERRGISA